MSHSIRVEGVRLRFAAAHFATFSNNLEPLHGHNYSVSAHIEGSLTPDSWVIDFGDAKRALRALCDELDHRLIVQAKSPLLAIHSSHSEVDVTFGTRRYVMPAADVVSLPIDNTTAERLAEYFATRLAHTLHQQGANNLTSVTIEIEEMPGQSGRFTLPLKQP